MNTKKLLLAGILIFTLIVGFIAWKVWNFEWAMEQDYAFMHKIRGELQNSGDVAKVSDIHPGNWEHVCAFSGGYDFEIKTMMEHELGHDRESFVVINNALDNLSSTFDNSVIVFQYNVNEIEIYHTTPKKNTNLSYGSLSNTENCLKKENAYFYLLNNKKLQLISKKEVKNGRT